MGGLSSLFDLSQLEGPPLTVRWMSRGIAAVICRRRTSKHFDPFEQIDNMRGGINVKLDDGGHIIHMDHKNNQKHVLEVL